ncbi:fibrinogen C domain-containing protein 1-like isoform X7 [Syngnathus scovelli]|uniref:fibrinogen C domain-containing protein 1-like isoform X7 n=1 Tax=Syngnathus scovelli TaxID=161590 RepID=UPI0035CABB55
MELQTMQERSGTTDDGGSGGASLPVAVGRSDTLLGLQFQLPSHEGQDTTPRRRRFVQIRWGSILAVVLLVVLVIQNSVFFHLNRPQDIVKELRALVATLPNSIPDHNRTDLARHWAALQTALAELKAELKAELEADLEAGQTSLAELKAELKAGQEAGQTALAELKAGQTALAELKAGQEAGQEALAELKAELKEGQKEGQTALAELKAGQTEVAQLKVGQEAGQEALAELKLGQEAGQTALAELKAGQEAGRTALAELKAGQTALAELKAGQEAGQEALAELKAELKEGQKEGQTALAELKAGQTEVAQLKVGQEAGQEALAQLKVGQEAGQTALAELKAGQEAGQTALRSNKGLLNQILKDLETDYKSMSQELSQEKKELHDVSGALSSLRQKVVDQPTLHRELLQGLMPRDCSDIKAAGKSTGVYLLFSGSNSFKAYCNMWQDGGGWTVIQRRRDDTVDFFRGWDDYREGFGDLTGGHWLGLRNIYALTFSGPYQLRIDFTTSDGRKYYARYDEFWVGWSLRDPEKDGYQLYVSGYSGDAGDRLSGHSGMKFSTKDRDQDTTAANCANLWKGAWWYEQCYWSSLNGLYKESGTCDGTNAIWRYLGGPEEPCLRFVEMKIRPRK